MKTRKSNRTKRFQPSPPSATSDPIPSDDEVPFASSPSHHSAISSSDSFSDIETKATSPKPRRVKATPKPKPVKSSKDKQPPPQPEYLDLSLAVQDVEKIRGYVGKTERGVRGQPLLDAFYGPQLASLEVMENVCDRWMGWPVLPPKGTDEDQATGLWLKDRQPLEARYAEPWLSRLRGSRKEEQTIPLTEDEAKAYLPERRPMPVLLGPVDSQREFVFHPGDAYSLSQAGIAWQEDKSKDKVPSGWMLDAGGIVTDMDWARRHDTNQPQILALAVTPFADQEEYDYQAESTKPGFQSQGTVQLWELRGEQTANLAPSTLKPAVKTLCFDTGRITRVKWCHLTSLLAVLCSDGGVRIVDVQDDANTIEKVTNPTATLLLLEDVKATAISWVALNRLAAGYSDGSIALWSIHPQQLLSRHPIHHSAIIDLASGYPTTPYLVSSTAVSGALKLVDLHSPSFETTDSQVQVISTQPGLLAYNDHLLGFFAMYPQARVINTMVSFQRVSHFPLPKTVYNSDSLVSCLAVGKCHPFLLVGSLDGSLWALNPLTELFAQRSKVTLRIRLFQHEHRPKTFFSAESPASERGVSRIIQGFAVEQNRNIHGEGKPGPKKTSKAAKAAIDDDDDERAGPAEAPKAALHEALTRITTMEWNPNDGYGCWAAVAMGSGIVRVLDLGLS